MSAIDPDVGLELSPEQEQRVLEERARRFAVTPPRVVRGRTLELLSFRLGAERYALETRFCLAVVRSPSITEVPRVQAVLRGVSLLRGEILPIADLGLLLGQSAGAEGAVLVLGSQRPELGLLVEAADEVFEVLAESLLAPAAAGEYFRGMTRGGVAVLDGNAILSDPRLRCEG